MTDKRNTMRIWQKVDETDPSHTKKVTFGRQFTAIDAHSQVMEATRQFGPVGEGWGYNTEFGTIEIPGDRVLAYCDVTLWWAEDGEWEGNKVPGNQRRYGPVRGSCWLVNYAVKDNKIQLDHDAFKKAMTDGITKALSHLGFNADVFLGKFDDNKYVQERQADANKAKEAEAAEYQKRRADFIKKIETAKTADEIDTILEKAEWINGLQPGLQAEIRSWAQKQKLDRETK